jgi:hypothetical protein
LSRTGLNVAIVLALAAAVILVPGAGIAAGALTWALGVAFLITLAWFAAVMYRRHRFDLLGLGDRNRAILYGAAVVAVLTVTATPRLWDSGAGTLVWFVLIGAACAGVASVWVAARRY